MIIPMRLFLQFSLLLLFGVPSSASSKNEEVIELFPREYNTYSVPAGNPYSTVSPDGLYVLTIKNYADPQVHVISVDDLRRGLNSTMIVTNIYMYHFCTWVLSQPHLLIKKHRDHSAIWLQDAATKQETLLINGTNLNLAFDDYYNTSKIVVTIFNPTSNLSDVYHMDLKTGQLNLVYKNPRFESFVYDTTMIPRLGSFVNKTTGMNELHKLRNTSEDATSDPWMTTNVFMHPDPHYRFISATNEFYYASRQYDNWARLRMQHMDKNESRLLWASNQDCEPMKILYEPRSASYVHQQTNCEMPKNFFMNDFDKAVAQCLKYFDLNTTIINFQSVARDLPRIVMEVIGTTETSCTFLCEYSELSSDIPPTVIRCHETYKYDAYDTQPIHHMHVKVDGGFNETCYYGLPLEADPYHIGVPNKPLPWVVFAHGGPHAAYEYEFDREQHFLNSRGYAFMACNFRGSTGYGATFEHSAGIGWDTKMRTDVIQPIKEILQRNWADPKRICLTGVSYGGYQVLLNAVREDRELFACFVDIFGVTDLPSLFAGLQTTDDYMRRAFVARMGVDGTTAEGNKTLLEQSPINELDKINKPILLVHGFKDTLVQQYHSDKVVSALRKAKKPHIYMLFMNDGHGLFHSANQLAYVSVLEQFLQKYLGGRAEPISDKAFDNAEFRYSQIDFDDIYVTNAEPNQDPCPPPICT